MITYFDKILYLYPDIQRVSYWHTKYDGSEWDDPYEGIVWENIEISKPSKETLDDLDENTVASELKNREEKEKFNQEVNRVKEDVIGKAAFFVFKQSSPSATVEDFVNYINNG